MLLGQGKLRVLTETLTGNRTLTKDEVLSYEVFAFDPGGAGRNIVLPAESNDMDGVAIIIENTANGAEILTVQNDTPATVCTPTQNESALVYYRGTPDGSWKGLVGASA